MRMFPGCFPRRDCLIAVYHEATVAGVRPRLATFSAALACLRPPTLPALRAVDSSEQSRGSSAGRLAHAVAREDDAHEDARRYYPLRALILYEEAQALGVVPRFSLGNASGGDAPQVRIVFPKSQHCFPIQD